MSDAQGLKGFGQEIQTVSAKVFELSDWTRAGEASLQWQSHDVGAGFDLYYYRLAVTTVENRSFGIEEGHEGTLHLFLSKQTNYSQGTVEGGPLPFDARDIDIYDSLFQSARSAAASEEGWKHLRAALRSD